MMRHYVGDIGIALQLHVWASGLHHSCFQFNSLQKESINPSIIIPWPSDHVNCWPVHCPPVPGLLASIIPPTIHNQAAHSLWNIFIIQNILFCSKVFLFPYYLQLQEGCQRIICNLSLCVRRISHNPILVFAENFLFIVSFLQVSRLSHYSTYCSYL